MLRDVGADDSLPADRDADPRMLLSTRCRQAINHWLTLFQQLVVVIIDMFG